MTMKKEPTTEDATLSTVYTKIHAVMQSLSFIEKDKRNDFHRYNYASEEAIKKAVHAQLVAQRLVFSVNMEECTVIETTTRKGDTTRLTTVKLNYCFTDIDNGTTLSGTFFGTGEDALDKGTYKALTGAIKYILTTTFLIPTGDDPEKESEAPPAKIPPAKVITKQMPPNTQPKEVKKPVATKEIIIAICQAIEGGDLSAYDKAFKDYTIGDNGAKMLKDVILTVRNTNPDKI